MGLLLLWAWHWLVHGERLLTALLVLYILLPLLLTTVLALFSALVNCLSQTTSFTFFLVHSPIPPEGTEWMAVRC